MADLRGALVEAFLPQHTIDAAMAALVRGRRGPVTPSDAAKVLLQVADLQFQAACWQNMLEGLLSIDLDEDGRILWRLTPEGVRVAENERDSFLAQLQA